MLKKMSIRKIIVATFTLFVLFILYLIPSKEKESSLKQDDIEYVYENNLDTIYLLDSTNYVAKTTITTCKCDGVDKAKDLLQGLIIEGEKNSIIPNGFKSIIPSGTKILDISLENGILTINFSKELLEVKAEYEEKMLESIIYTLTSIEGIDKVIINVEGNPLTNLPNSNKTVPSSLDRQYGINKIYELVNLNNIDSYTVYYVNKYNDNNYYVPVTKYVNNTKDDKIKVIVEQLSSAPIYETNLMSYLNVSTKLLDYELNEQKLKLNFNNMILNDITSNEILEEVIYTISLSMNQLYDIEEVVFSVENEEIYTILLNDIE